MMRSASPRSLATVAVLVVAGGLGLSADAGACAVCYGDADSLMTKGMNNGILVLLAVVAVVQVGFVTLFLSIRRRSRRLRRRKARFHLIQGGAG